MKKSMVKLILIIAMIGFGFMLAACSNVPTQKSLQEQQDVQSDEQKQLRVSESPPEPLHLAYRSVVENRWGRDQ